MKQYQKKSWLWQEYIDNKRSLRAIADECGSSHTTIYRHLRLFGIPIRTQKESVTRKGAQRPQKRKTQTVQEYVEKLKKLDEAIEEVKEWREIIKALKGQPSEFYVSPSEAEANRLKGHAEQRRLDREKLLEDEAFEKRRRGDTGAWHTGDWREQLEDIMYDLGEKI